MKLMVIISWFLGVKVGEIEFENWGVGCVCKSFPLCFHLRNFGVLYKIQDGKLLIVLYGCKFQGLRVKKKRLSIHLAKCVVFISWFRGMARVGRSWFSN